MRKFSEHSFQEFECSAFDFYPNKHLLLLIQSRNNNGENREVMGELFGHSNSICSKNVDGLKG